MEWELLLAFFHGSATTPLLHLGLDVVEHRGFRILDGGVPRSPLPADGPHKKELSDAKSNRREYFKLMSRLQRVRHLLGPVSGLLPLATSRCTSLTSLFIRKERKPSHQKFKFRDEAGRYQVYD